MILSTQTLYCLNLQMKMACFLKIVPYQLNPVTGNIEVSHKRKTNLLWKLNLLATYSYAFFIYGRFYELLKFTPFQEINKVYFVLHLAWVTGMSILVVGHISIWHRKQEITDFINSFLMFLQRIEGIHMRIILKPCDKINQNWYSNILQSNIWFPPESQSLT